MRVLGLFCSFVGLITSFPISVIFCVLLSATHDIPLFTFSFQPFEGGAPSAHNKNILKGHRQIGNKIKIKDDGEEM